MGVSRILEVLPEIRDIADPVLRDKVAEIWDEAVRMGGWSDVMDIPFNPKVGEEPALVTHVRAVTLAAKHYAEVLEGVVGKAVDHDLLLAASLLHDVSKAVEYGVQGGRVGKTELGEKIPHGVFGAYLAWKHGLSLDLVHLIITHTATIGMAPVRLEGVILRYADLMDADVHYFRAGLPMLMQKSH